MKKLIIILFVLNITILLGAQTTTQCAKEIDAKQLYGRWIETERIGEVVSNEAKEPSILIFRDNGMFHQGADKKGVILFAITGKYNMVADSIQINYFDLMSGTQGERKLIKLKFNIVELSDAELVMKVNESGKYKYTARYRKQEFGATVENKKISKQ